MKAEMLAFHHVTLKNTLSKRKGEARREKEKQSGIQRIFNLHTITSNYKSQFDMVSKSHHKCSGQAVWKQN